MFDPIRKIRKTEEEQKKEKPKKKKREFRIQEKKRSFGWKKFILIFFLIVLMIILFFGGWFVYNLGVAKNKIVTENFSQSTEKKDINLPEAKESEFDLATVNILLLGNGGVGHSGGGLTDVIQVLSINTQKKKALSFSIPRDLFVNLPGFGKHRVNAAYVLGESRGKGIGGDLSKKKIQEIVGIPIHYYFKVDFTGFKKIVDLMEGVDVFVDKPIYDPAWGYSISAGVHHFNGARTLDYVRSRKSTSDFDRSKRQQNILFALRDKAILNHLFLNPLKISEFIEVAGDNIRTDITPKEMLQIFSLAKEMKREDLTTFVLDNRESGLLYSTISSGGAYILLPKGGNYKKIQKKIKELLP